MFSFNLNLNKSKIGLKFETVDIFDMVDTVDLTMSIDTEC